MGDPKIYAWEWPTFQWSVSTTVTDTEGGGVSFDYSFTDSVTYRISDGIGHQLTSTNNLHLYALPPPTDPANDADTIYAGTGNDSVLAGEGNDLVDAGPGNDIVFGEKGNDTLLGQAGDDILKGGGDNDVDGKDFIDGGTGNDKIWGGAGRDTLFGGGDVRNTGAIASDDSARKFPSAEKYFLLAA